MAIMAIEQRVQSMSELINAAINGSRRSTLVARLYVVERLYDISVVRKLFGSGQIGGFFEVAPGGRWGSSNA